MDLIDGCLIAVEVQFYYRTKNYRGKQNLTRETGVLFAIGSLSNLGSNTIGPKYKTPIYELCDLLPN